jgi:D-beta-D-heptose 7-phosphate kinase/D-beta-D-heptose 1-phosphate adenosyltransferase
MKNNYNGKSPYLSGSVWPAGKNGNGATLPATTISELSAARVKHLIIEATRHKVLVLGDIMLDEFIWGSVKRISPEAPVPVVQLERESFMPGGAANVARNLAALQVPSDLFSVIGKDDAGKRLKGLLSEANVGSEGCLCSDSSVTTVKTRIIAHQQQVVRLDRECVSSPDKKAVCRLMRLIEEKLASAAALIIGDYGKGIVTQPLLNWLKETCEVHGVWLSMDPKPAHTLDLSEVSLLTPNRKEAFELAGASDTVRCSDPLKDQDLLRVADTLLNTLRPGVLLITLGEHGMLLCEDGKPCVHIPTVAKQVFDVSGAGDTVIAIFTAAISAGGSPIEAAMLANCAAGVVVGKVGTATASAQELIANALATNAELTPRYGVMLGNRKSKNGSSKPKRIRIPAKVRYE